MKKSSTIQSFRFGKNGVGIALANGQTLPVSEQLLLLLAKSTGFSSVQQLVLNGVGATISYEETAVKVGDPVTNNGKAVVDAAGNPRVFTKDHIRYNNISVQLTQAALIAVNVGAQLAAMFQMPVAAPATSPVKDSLQETPEEIPAGGALMDELHPGA